MLFAPLCHMLLELPLPALELRALFYDPTSLSYVNTHVVSGGMGPTLILLFLLRYVALNESKLRAGAGA